MDENNQIIKLVHEGMKMERENKIDQAQNLFMQAWNSSSNDHEKCISAHFVARHQNSPENTLKWNMESLNRANDVSKEKVRSYYSSLYLNAGVSYEDLDNYSEAMKYYDLAFKKLPDLPTDKDSESYSKGVRESILERRNKLKEKIY